LENCEATPATPATAAMNSDGDAAMPVVVCQQASGILLLQLPGRTKPSNMEVESDFPTMGT